jgi:hypothetical protein
MFQPPAKRVWMLVRTPTRTGCSGPVGDSLELLRKLEHFKIHTLNLEE